MKKQLLHPATLIAAIALLVALEIPSDAARLIDGKLLKRNSVSGAKLKTGSVSAGKLSRSVRAKLALAGRPGPTGQTGPSGPKGDTGPAGAGLSCPNGTALHELACIELTQRAAQTWTDALGICQAAKRRLASFAELQAFRFRDDLNPPTVGSEWVDSMYGDPGSEKAIYMTMNTGTPGAALAKDNSAKYNFRCVAPATVAAG